jgi:hypothetical protein
LGFQAIYTSTESARGIMERQGWQAIGTSQSLRGEITVFRKEVSGELAQA